MKHILFLLAVFCCCQIAFSQETTFDEALAKSVGADEYGMKKYVFCLLKTGSNTTASKEKLLLHSRDTWPISIDSPRKVN
jgi:hypothetical protein